MMWGHVKSRYCLVRRVVASSVPGGKKVIFDETFTFLVEGEELKNITVKVEIYDKDSMGGDELGTCDVNLQNLQDTKKKVTSVKRARRRSAVECVVWLRLLQPAELTCENFNTGARVIWVYAQRQACGEPVPELYLASLLMLSDGSPQGADEQLAAKQADALFREVLSALRERKTIIVEDRTPICCMQI
jgi:hypothetical protein